MKCLRFNKIPLDAKNRMLRAGIGLHDSKWFCRVDLWWFGVRVTFVKKERPT